MIMVTSPSKPFTYTTKGVPRRVPVLRDYEDEIEALYATVEQSSGGDVPVPSSWDSDSVKNFVHTVVQRILNQSVPENADIFRNGCDRRVFFDESQIRQKRLIIDAFQPASHVYSQHDLARTTRACPDRGEEAPNERHVPSAFCHRFNGCNPAYSIRLF